ncbi:site-specific integrase [Sulfitobacter sp. D35]|uniref:site-specific integrase n=1 Tax=Sulfitobacter sp. D35 TaxID=3083252 RepID=UPI00296F3C80|nr:site-specific integrase [Sulfitobacter sp. D35]MDW4500208.1 site-specific integrase [Sulfitobacter sp. D35]
MPRFDHTAFVNACRDERGVGHHTLRAYAQDLRTFSRFTEEHRLGDRLSRDDILAYHRHLRDVIEAKPATIERRLSTLKSYFAWREGRNAALPPRLPTSASPSGSRDACRAPSIATPSERASKRVNTQSLHNRREAHTTRRRPRRVPSRS